MIDILVPTRARPKRVETLLRSIINTAFDINKLTIYFYVDHDDSVMINNIESILKKFLNLHIEFRIGPRIVLSCAWNQLWKMGGGGILMHCADDIQFETQHWDKIVYEEFDKYPDNIVLVFGRDGLQNDRLATHSFTSRTASDVLGYFVPPYFKTMYNDTWLDEIYGKIGRRVYNPNICTRHYHETLYPEYKDETAIELHKYEDEAKKIWNETKDNREKDVEKLLKEINSYK